MRAGILALALAQCAVPAMAQVSYPPAPTEWVKQQDVVLDASGNATWTFDPADPPPIVPVVVHMPKALDASDPITCNWMTRATTSVSIHCWRTKRNGLLSDLLGGPVTGATVTLVARAIP